jgi:hypothetical protein
MAYYCGHDVRHRGRLYTVPLRYGVYGGGGRITQLKGKPLRRTPKDNRKIIARAERHHCRSCYY